MRAIADRRSPGLVGAAMLIGGEWGVALLLPLYVVAVRLGWGWPARSPIAPVALALATETLLTFTSEGTLQYQNWVVLGAVVLLCGRLARHLVPLRQVVPLAAPGQARAIDRAR